MPDKKISGEQARAGRVVKGGRIAKIMLLTMALAAIGLMIANYLV